MTSKKKRQRGSRTHGGGTHKNRRGAGHRGGRGRAGRDKHEQLNYEPLGKHGFTRPDAVTDEVLTVGVQSLDEDASLLAAEGIAEETDGGYRIDARDVVDDGHEVDASDAGSRWLTIGKFTPCCHLFRLLDFRRRCSLAHATSLQRRLTNIHQRRAFQDINLPPPCDSFGQPDTRQTIRWVLP